MIFARNSAELVDCFMILVLGVIFDFFLSQDH